MSGQSEKPVVVACPNCGVEVTWENRNKFRPFCSERCKLMDLGLWASERYRVAGDKLSEELGNESPLEG